MEKKKEKKVIYFFLRQNAPVPAASHNLDPEWWITCEDRLVQRSANGFKQ